MRYINREYLLKQIDNFEQDIGSVLDLLNGESTIQECWDTTNLNNWKAILNFLNDSRIYLDDIDEPEGFDGNKVDDDGNIIVDSEGEIFDDIPPEDSEEEEDNTTIKGVKL
jgi:hypothetical protein